jgi:hypothetical protein
VKDGDLSNQVSPSLLIIFEGAIGVLKEEDREKFLDAALTEANPRKAIDYFYLNDIYLRKINDLVWRKGFNIEVITFMDDDMAKAIADRLDDENVIVHDVWATQSNRLARQLAYMPRVACVYDPNPAHRFRYGSKGVLLTDPNQIGSF